MAEQIEDKIDIKETDLYKKYPEAFRELLRDNSRFHMFKLANTGMSEEELNQHRFDPDYFIIWATEDYVQYGEDYSFHKPITVEKITGENGMIIRPRCKKSSEEQIHRSKDKAEVFTPSWVCNAQNNLVDEAWFGRNNVFNREVVNDDIHSWETNTEPISFEGIPENKSWKDYVRDTRLEITCGEAPYLASRYDTTSGEYIEIKNRIGLLDRKLRVISENCKESGVWLEMAQEAFKNIYGYEWQGDNLLIARESLLYTFIEYYFEQFGKLPLVRSVNAIAEIITWNIWQMDGLKMVVPKSCDNVYETGLFGETTKCSCPACEKGNFIGHIGISCIIKNWRKPIDKQEVKFSTLIN